MISQRENVDYVPHSRDKKWLLTLPQLKSAVSPDPLRREIPLPKRGFLGGGWLGLLAGALAALLVLWIFTILWWL